MAATTRPPRWTRFAPARKNSVNAVNASTDEVPRSGSSRTSTTTGTVITRNGTVPGPEAPDAAAPLREPVGEVDDQRELHELGRVDRRQRTDLEPACRAADDDVDLGHEHEDQADDPDGEQGHGRDPQPAVVHAHHRHHRDHAQRRPLDLRPDDRERVVALEVRLHRRRRVDHQDSDRGQRDDGDEDPVLGLVALALERDLRLRPRGRSRRGADGGQRRRAHGCAPRRPTAAMNARPRAA